MLSRSGLWIALVAVSGVLVAGCGMALSPKASGRGASAALQRPDTPSGKKGDTPDNDVVEAHAHYATAVVYELEDKPNRALEEYYQAALKDPANESLTLEVSRRLIEAKELNKALNILTGAAARPSASGELYARLGYVNSRLGNLGPAIKANRTAVRKAPRSMVGYQNLFLNYLQNTQDEQAFRVLGEAAKVPGTDAPFLIRLGELYASLGVHVPSRRKAADARAVAVLERADKLDVSDPELRLRLADGFNLLGKDHAAERLYLGLLKDLPDVPLARDSIRAKLANLYLRDGDSESASRQLEAVIRDNPTDAQAYYSLGTIAYAAREYSKASEAFTKVILLNPDFQPAYFDLAFAQLAEDKNRAALRTLDQARGKFQQSFVQEYLLGTANLRLKDYTNALTHFTTAEIIAGATDTNRLTDIFYFQLGAASERVGDYAQAEQYFEKCLRLSPDFAEALNYLGFMWADRGEKLSRARDLIARALKVDPGNAAYLDSMGWVLYKLHQPEAALDYILNAIKLSPEADPTIYDHLGDIYAALGETAKAHAAWQKSLSLQPSKDVRKKLEPSGAP